MPLPTPNRGEGHDDFIERCMEDETVQQDFDDEDQRLAVCERQFSEERNMSTEPEHKAISEVEIKDADEGVIEARFATLGVKDKDGDVIQPGAFGEQSVRVSAFNHESWKGALPVGKGTIREEGDEAIADLQFFMDTSHGRDHFRTIKNLGELGEWSFGFDITEEDAPSEEQQESGVHRVLKGLEVHEVSPVLRGAGRDTGTLSAKCDACAAKEDDDETDVETEGLDEETKGDEAAVEVGRALLRQAKEKM